jgi:dGTPase
VFPQDVGSILQAACLAHDIGNPPFGHGGEFAIRAWFKQNHHYLAELKNDLERLDLENYEANAQGLRVLTQLEGHLFNGGLRPTYATLGTFIKYPWSSGHAASAEKHKFGFFQTEKEHMSEIASELGLFQTSAGCWARHPLVFLVEAADDICYAIVDLEDALEMGILEFNEVESILLGGLNEDERTVYATISDKDHPRQLGYLRGKVVDYLVRQVISAFVSSHQEILSGTFADDLISHCENDAMDIVKSAKRLAQERIFSNTKKLQIEIGAYAVIDVLLKACCDAYQESKRGSISFKSQLMFNLLAVDAPAHNSEAYPALIRIADFVSGCTDKYAAQLSQRLSGAIF